MSFATGWFAVGWSTDFPAGEVRRLRYLGKELVGFRGESGDVSVLDAYCPHLGAHLGVGGRVRGDTLECPFHAWRFDRGGTCVDIPYASKIPKRARVHAHPVVERNDVVFLWNGPGEPTWEVPTLPRDGWTPWFTNILPGVRTRPREIVENVADKAHFPIVHRTTVEVFENVYEDHMATQHTVGLAYPPQGGVDHFDIVATYHGPAFQLSDMKGHLHSRLFLAHTPIDDDTLDLRFAVSLREGDAKTERYAQFYVENLRLGFHEDIAIWENKVYRDVPRLVDGDGPIGSLRRWYAQFF